MEITIDTRVIGGYDAKVIYNKGDKAYTITSANNKGGAIISHTNKAIAEKRFVEAMDLWETVTKLIYFKTHKKFPVNI